MKMGFLKMKGGKRKTFSRFLFFGKNPYRDWRILVLFFALIGILIMSVHLYQFSKIIKEPLSTSIGEDTTSESLNIKAIKEIQTDFENKKKKLEELKEDMIGIADPSL